MNLPTVQSGGPGEAGGGVCRLLRTKTAFGSYMLETDDNEGAEGGWQAGTSTTAVFWCLKTMDTCGPDDGFAHAHSCRRGRECFRPDED